MARPKVGYKEAPPEEKPAEEMPTETPETPEAPAAAEEPTPEELKAQNEALQKENAALRGKPAPAPNPAPASARATLTSRDLETLTDEQWEYYEKQTGMERKEILDRVRHRELSDRTERIEAKENVSDAIDVEVAKDARNARLKPLMREYLDGLPASEKLDKDRLARHVEAARFYAMGKQADKRNPTVTGKRPADTGHQADTVGEGEPEFPSDDPRAVAFGKPFKMEGGVERVVEKRMPDEMRKASKHPEDPNGVQFTHKFDAPPRFG